MSPNLRLLVLGRNDISGSILEEIGDLKMLEVLQIPACKFSGAIPWSVGDLRSLKELDISVNNFKTEVPASIGKLGNLTRLFANSAGLIGKIQRELVHLSSNSITGSIPEELADLEAIDTFCVEGNNLSGLIPDWTHNWVHLHDISLGQNMFYGPLPLLSLQHLVSFSAETNMLSVAILHNNNLTGNIKETFKGCKNLTELDLRDNHLHDDIPHYLAELPLVRLQLSLNNFTGKLPQKLWESSTLLEISLSYNKLTGFIPESMGGLSSLQRLQNTDRQVKSLLCKDDLLHLHVSNNRLSGQIPFVCPKEKRILKLTAVLQCKQQLFSGNLDDSISNFTQLSSLDVHNNNLNESLPSALSDLRSLNYLDLSSNNFHGAIPCGICNIYGLTFANFSANHIGMDSLAEADCAAAGICIGNDIDRMAIHSSHRVLRATITCVILAAIAVLILLVVYLIWKRLRSKPLAPVTASKSNASVEPTSSNVLLEKKSREPLSINVATFEHTLLRVTADDILKATENFRRCTSRGFMAAISSKVFQGDRGFLAEMETNGKLGYCVCRDERFLIYEYMENGSLEMCLKNRTDAVEALGWPDRLKICLGSARGLAFLHHGFVPHIIHRDMKSSNILLDENFEPRVSDFGLARIISACDTHEQMLCVLSIARDCTVDEPWKGPTMMEVVKGLKMAQTMECGLPPPVVKISRSFSTSYVSSGRDSSSSSDKDWDASEAK
ncbi:hypothetical protein EJB05_33274, partial [Eragrostis curvula]